MTVWGSIACVVAASVPDGPENDAPSPVAPGETAETGTPLQPFDDSGAPMDSSPPADTAGTGGDSGDGPPTPPVPTDTGSGGGSVVCPTWALVPELLGTLSNVEIDEASGLVVSRIQPGVLWLNNDRNDVEGDLARVFAVARDGADLGTFWLEGVENYDFEAMTSGVGPDGTPWLFVGDVGDNDHGREDVAIVGFPEPEVDYADPADHLVAGAEVYRATWPLDPVPNTEAMALDPVTGDLWLLTKSQVGLSSLARYPLPLRAGETVELDVLGDVVITGPSNLAVTDLAVSPDGSMIVARTYSSSLTWLRKGQDVLDALAVAPCIQDLPPQNLGETLTFDVDDESLITVSEGAGAAVLRLPAE